MDKTKDTGIQPGETYQHYVERLPTDLLLGQYKSLSFTVDKLECFGVRDCVLLDWLDLELTRRGVKL
jgi:hypothetical protein